MIYDKNNAFKDGIFPGEDYADLFENADPAERSIPDRDGPFFSFSALLKNASLPSILTDANLMAYYADEVDPKFEDILCVSGEKVVFRHRYARERFMEFAKKVKEMNPIIYTMSDIFSIFEHGCFEKIISFRSVCDMFGRIKILISVLTFETERVVNPVILQDLFGFTPAEGRLAALLVNGKSVIECAEVLGVRISTVREQLSNLFAKTQTSRQPELVSMLSRLDLLV